MNDNGGQLTLRFDPLTIEHLGLKMYSRLPAALAELIANAYDADAKNIILDLSDEEPDKMSIVIKDDGDGMSFQRVQDDFLVIGRKRREYDSGRVTALGRKITGKKGVGKLALFGIGKTIRIITCSRDDISATEFVLDWEQILQSTGGEYHPICNTTSKPFNHGTVIELSNLSRISKFRVHETAVALAKLFNFYDSNNIEVKITHNGDDNNAEILSQKMQFENINRQFEWKIHDLADVVKASCEYKMDLTGEVMSSTKPISPELRGIALYANGRLVNMPSFFGVSEARYAFSYLTGWINADFLDEDDGDDDIISTDRQSINWDSDRVCKLREYLQAIIRYVATDWSKKRKGVKEDRRKSGTGIDIGKWKEEQTEDTGRKLADVLDNVNSIDSLDDSDADRLVESIHNLVPEYADYHFRRLNDDLQQKTKNYYKKQEYYAAVSEACAFYVQSVRKKIISEYGEDFFKRYCEKITSDSSFVSKVFCNDREKRLLDVAHQFIDHIIFTEQMSNDFNCAQRELSCGIIAGFRNPIAHIGTTELKEKDIVSELECLDALSVVSMLVSRLDKAVKNNTIDTANGGDFRSHASR